MKKSEIFNKLKDDTEKWQWLIDNKDSGYTVMLDNDDTFVVFDDDEESYGQFSDYIGWSEGVFNLLTTIGINHGGV